MNRGTRSLGRLVGNIHETIAWVHYSFAVLFSRLFSWRGSNHPGPQKEVNEMGRRQTEIYYPSEAALSEISFALAAGVLDRAGAAFLSSQPG